MLYDYTVPTPHGKGEISFDKKDSGVYVQYTYGRVYIPEKQYNVALRKVIGKLDPNDPEQMYPNKNYYTYYFGMDLPNDNARKREISVGAFIVIDKVIKETNLSIHLRRAFDKERDIGLALDLATYSVISESNVAQYYPNYCTKHPSFTPEMRIYSDATVSKFLNSITTDQIFNFLISWNKEQDHKQKIYVSYDSTSKDCQSSSNKKAKKGHAKVDTGKTMINYAVAYDVDNKVPLFYHIYAGNINDVSDLQFMVDKAISLEYNHIGFILDRGYFSKPNLNYIDEQCFSFVIMLKGQEAFVNDLVRSYKGTFETRLINDIERYGVYGVTIPCKLCPTDEKDRYIHLYHSVDLESKERGKIEENLAVMKEFVRSKENSHYQFSKQYHYYFRLHYEGDSDLFLFGEPRLEVFEEELRCAGYFCLVTSDKMTAEEAIYLYKNRDQSEKLFQADKSFLGNSAMRVHSEESSMGKMFIQFIALIIRSNIYQALASKEAKMHKKPNFMNVPAAIAELEDITMIRLTDEVYRLEDYVDKDKAIILDAFDINRTYVKDLSRVISDKLNQNGGKKNNGKK